jgi:hypothetical protein
MSHRRKPVRVRPLQLFVCILIQPLGFALGWFLGFALGVW